MVAAVGGAVALLSNHKEDQAGNFGDEFPGYAWQSSIKDVNSEIIGSFPEKMKQINVTVTFNEEELVYTITTYRLIQE